MRQRLVVIGGDAAGMSAASQARRRKGPDELEIVAFERGNFTSYSACGIPYLIGGAVDRLERLVVRTPEEFSTRQSIKVRIRHEVVEIDLDKGAVKAVDRNSGDETWEAFDHLVIATGAVPIRPPLVGLETNGIFGVQVLDDAVTIQAWLEKEQPSAAVVVGGGYIGLEMAEAFRTRGLDTTLVEWARQPMRSLDEDMGALVADAMKEMGIVVRTNEKVIGFEASGGRISGVVTENGTIPAQIVVLGLGARPNSELAQAAGLEIGPTDGIVVDRQMATQSEGVWAAGDCAQKFHLVSRRPVAFALGTHANKEGRIAGINIGGGYATFPGVLGTAVSKICDVEVARTGLGEGEAEAAGFEHLAVVVDSTTRAGYFPGTQPIKIKLVVEKRSGRLLGAQIVGREGAAKRIDVLAAMLWNEMTVDRMLNVDLSYAPPFAPVWDPVLIAARKAWQQVEDQNTSAST